MDFPYGHILPEPPQGFVPREQWPEYIAEGHLPAFVRPRQVGSAPRGKRWGLGPITMEEYISDTEPDLQASDRGGAPPRIIFWRRVSRHDKPVGWHQLSSRPSQVEGFALLGEDYWRKWDESARRYRRQWHADYAGKTHVLEQVEYQEFIHAYKNGTVSPKAGSTQLDALARLCSRTESAPHTSLRAVRELATKTLLAGVATVHSPTHATSYYQAGFVVHGAPAPLMIGLIDDWHMRSQKDGVSRLDFGGFWHPGKSKKIWQGYSSFKAKFGLQYIAYPPELVRIRGWSVR